MKMDKILFLLLINIMKIFCSNKIKNNKYFETYKNLRYLEEDYVPTTVPSTEPDNPTTVPSTEPEILTSVPSTEPDNPTTVPSAEPDNPTTVPSTEPEIPTTVPSTEPDNPTTVPSTEPEIPTTVPSTEPDIPTTVPIPSSYTPLFLFLGLDNYNDNEEENILYFFIKYFIEYGGEYKEMPITLLINKNLRFLAETEETIKCPYVSDSSNVYIFNCSLNYTGQSIQSIKVKPPENSTDYAIYTCNNVKD